MNNIREHEGSNCTKEIEGSGSESEMSQFDVYVSKPDGRGRFAAIHSMKKAVILGDKKEIDKDTMVRSIYRQLDQLTNDMPAEERLRVCRVILRFYKILLREFNHKDFISTLEMDQWSQKSIVLSISYTMLTKFSTEFINYLDRKRPMGVILFFFVMLAEKFKWKTFSESLAYFNSCESSRIPSSLLKHTMIVIGELKSTKKIPDNEFINFLLFWLNKEKEFNFPNCQGNNEEISKLRT